MQLSDTWWAGQCGSEDGGVGSLPWNICYSRHSHRIVGSSRQAYNIVAVYVHVTVRRKEWGGGRSEERSEEVRGGGRNMLGGRNADVQYLLGCKFAPEMRMQFYNNLLVYLYS